MGCTGSPFKILEVTIFTIGEAAIANYVMLRDRLRPKNRTAKFLGQKMNSQWYSKLFSKSQDSPQIFKETIPSLMSHRNKWLNYYIFFFWDREENWKRFNNLAFVKNDSAFKERSEGHKETTVMVEWKFKTVIFTMKNDVTWLFGLGDICYHRESPVSDILM